MERELVVIGGGPAGYVAALRAAQLGAKVTLVEEKALGGTCLNCGCIPAKFLLHRANLYRLFKEASSYGLRAQALSFDLAQMQKRKREMVATLVSGIERLLRRMGIEVIRGRAHLKPRRRVEVKGGGVIETRKIILATGSRPVTLPIQGTSGQGVMSAEDILSLEELPQSMAIIGGGAIGVEMATLLSHLGCRVSLLELMPHLLPSHDTEIASILENAFKKEGVSVYCGAKLERIEDCPAGKKVFFSSEGSTRELEAKAVAICIGFKPNIEGLGLDECDVEVEDGHIKVNERMETSSAGIYAAGDVVGGMMLAYIGFAEGMVAAENALGLVSKVDYQVVPQCIFTSPEVSSVGLTEDEALERGYKLEIGRFPFIANGMAHILGERRGLVKIIAERRYGKVLGVHIIGPGATSLIQEAAAVMKLEGTVEDILSTIHPHPSLSEAVWEAALGVYKRALHFSS